MKNLKLILIALLTLTISCKTREDIARDQKIDAMNSEMKDRQKLSADLGIRLQELETQITDLSGKSEEERHQSKEVLEKSLMEMSDRIKVLEENQKLLTEKATAQENYIAEVLKELKKLSSKSTKRSRGKNGKKLSLYDSAMSDYKRGRYKSAKGKLEQLLGQKGIKGTKKGRVIHNLGMIAFIQKDNTAALTYFSKLFTEMPKSGYNKNGLLFLGKTFKRLGQTEEMKQTLSELITRWPQAKQVKEAKKLLK